MDRRRALKTVFVSLAGLAQTGALGSRKSHSQARDLAAKEQLRSRLTRNLSDVVDAWFPRTMDVEHGGFLCDFDRDWRPNGPQRKRLEYQSRQVRAGAEA